VRKVTKSPSGEGCPSEFTNDAVIVVELKPSATRVRVSAVSVRRATSFVDGAGGWLGEEGALGVREEGGITDGERGAGRE
jgi:hypothetical protein